MVTTCNRKEARKNAARPADARSLDGKGHSPRIPRRKKAQGDDSKNATQKQTVAQASAALSGEAAGPAGGPVDDLAPTQHDPEIVQGTIRFRFRKGRAEIVSRVLKQVGRPDAGPRVIHIVARPNKETKEAERRGEAVLVLPFIDPRVML